MSERSDANRLDVDGLPGDRSARRRAALLSGIRILAVAVALLALYVFLPVPGSPGRGVLVRLIAGLVIFLVLVGWQIRTILRAEHPVLRAVEVVAFVLPLAMVVFAFAYLSLSRAEPTSFSERLDRVGALYYTVSTISTVGFGDITASSNEARILVTLQMLFDLALIAGLVRLVILATRAGLRRRGVGSELVDRDGS